MIRSPLLSQLDWLDHGFGTRVEPSTQNGMASLQQIHSAVVLNADAPGLIGAGDALVTSHSGVAVSVRTADCYPILLVNVQTRVVAAVHAGWRGTAAHIVSEALQRLNDASPSAPQNIFAAIGPGIGVCCYEVGEDVARQFGQHAGKLDLAAENYRQLREAGLTDRNIDVIGDCTFCQTGMFHSFRRDKDQAGRMISYIAQRLNTAPPLQS